MSEDTAAPTAPENDADNDADAGVDAISVSTRRSHLVERLTAVVAVAPIFISAVRNGIAGWEPTRDSGTVAVLVRDVFTAHPPLIGPAASTSLGAAQQYSFPGTVQLYLLALPVELLGTTWGLLLGMATINSAACLAAIWLVRRRVGERGAILAAAIVASLTWTAGSQVVVDPTPLLMGVLPLFAFFVAAWSVADADPPALLVLAAIGNYLLLGQLKFTVVVPLVGATALVLLTVRLFRSRANPRGPDGSHLRWFAAATLLTLLMWAPPLVDQFAGSGNLGKLVDAARNGVSATPGPELSSRAAAGVVTSVTATPSWWLPPSYAHVPFAADGHGDTTSRMVWGLGVGALAVVAVTRSLRRRDRTAVTALAIASTGWCAAFVTARLNPSPFGFAPIYLRELWPLSAFIWFALAVSLWRSVPRDRRPVQLERRTTTFAAAALVVVIAAAAIPVRYTDTAPDGVEPGRRVRSLVASGFAGSGPVQVEAKIQLEEFQPSVVLGLQDAGVPFRFPGPYEIQQFGSRRSSARGDVVRRAVLSESSTVPTGGRLVGRITMPAMIDEATFRALDARMHEFAAGATSLRAADEIVTSADQRREFDAFAADIFHRAAETPGGLAESSTFIDTLSLASPNIPWPLFDMPGFTPSEVVRWAREKRRRAVPHLYLYSVPVGGSVGGSAGGTAE